MGGAAVFFVFDAPRPNPTRFSRFLSLRWHPSRVSFAAMKAGIHPVLHKDAKTICSTCSAVYQIPATVKEMHVETCRACHPVYTGKKQTEMRGGRVERFRKRMSAKKA